jgi:hypothetical protein
MAASVPEIMDSPSHTRSDNIAVQYVGVHSRKYNLKLEKKGTDFSSKFPYQYKLCVIFYAG